MASVVTHRITGEKVGPGGQFYVVHCGLWIHKIDRKEWTSWLDWTTCQACLDAVLSDEQVLADEAERFLADRPAEPPPSP